MKKKKHQSPETRQQQILLAAEIVLLKEGIERFTVDQVVRHAQIAKGTVYKYYKNKDHLLAELSVKSVSMLFSAFKEGVVHDDSSIDKIKSVIQSCYTFYKTLPHYYSLLNYFENNDANPAGKSKYIQISYDLQHFIEQIIDEGKERKEITTSTSTKYLDMILWSSCVGMIQFIENKKELIPDFNEIDQDKLIEDFSNHFTKGLTN